MLSRVLAIIFSLLSFGAVQETFRIFTSHDADIVGAGPSLKVISVTITVVLVVLSIIFWMQKPKPKN